MPEQQTTPQKANRTKGRVWKTIGVAALALLLALYVLFPFGMGAIASVRKAQAEEVPPEGYEAVRLTAADDTSLACWYAAGENGACVLLLHGSNGGLASVTGHAKLLRNAGYGVLALTLRGHGGSGGRGNALGWQCGQDVAAAVQFLKEQGVQRIGALGLSLGGEVLLASASDEPDIRAVAADGATHHTLSDYLELPGNRPLWRSWTTRVMYASAALLTGQRPPERTIKESIQQAIDTRFLLIAAGNVPSESAYGALYESAASGRAKLWIVPGAGHTQGFQTVPDAYSEEALAFFNKTLAE